MTHGNEDRTPNLACPNCKKKTMHTDKNWKKYHPRNRTGYQHDVSIPKKTNA